MELPPNYEYFEKNSKYEKLIKEQGDTVCQHKIGNNYIANSLKNYLFGFLHKVPVAQIGQKKKKSAPINLYSFILCKSWEDNDFLTITLVCSRAHDGKKLIELAEIQASVLGYKKMALHSIMDEKVVRWYKSQGFEILSEQEDMDTGEIKSYFMMKRIA
jgi:hypothetical protein